jgi:cytidylate kinase
VIRTAEVEAASSEVAAVPAVRHFLVRLQRAIAAGRDMVCEGRDQGTVVFPDAGSKFFLTAGVEERVRRRQRQMEARNESVDLAALREAVQVRDRRDAERDLAPMKPADDAVVLDTTDLTLDQVADLLEREVRHRLE